MKLFLLLAVLALASAKRKATTVDVTWTFDEESCNAPGGTLRLFTVDYLLEVVNNNGSSDNNGNDKVKTITVRTSLTTVPSITVTDVTDNNGEKCVQDKVLLPGETYQCNFTVFAVDDVVVNYLSEVTREFNNKKDNNNPPPFYTVAGPAYYYKAATLEITGETNATCFLGTNGQVTVRVVANAESGPYSLYLGTDATGTLLNASLAANTWYTITNLGAGAGSVYAQSAIGCSASASFTLYAPSEVVIATAVTDPICFGDNGSVKVDATGGTGPYTFKLNNGEWTSPVGLTWTFSGPAGKHNVSARDANGCVSAVTEITITNPADFGVTASATLPECYVAPNATITASITGDRTGTFDFALTKPGDAGFVAPPTQSLPKGTSAVFVNLTAGTYVVTATNAGCSRTYTIVVAEASCYCALSQGYWKTHPEQWPLTNCTAACSNWCSKSFAYYLGASPKGNRVIIAGKQFAAFVLNFFYYNTKTNIRLTGLPADFNATIAAAFASLNSESAAVCGGTDPNLTSNAGLLESFNSHNSTIYSWNTQCTPVAFVARTLISTIRK